jgi:hypothetical protein
MKLKHNGVGIADMYSDEECFLTTTTMPLDEDLTRYTAPPDNEPDPNEYQSAHIIHYIYKSIPDHDRDYDLEEVIEILKYALEYIKDEDIGIDTI